MLDEFENLDGVRKAAIVLLAIGEECASKVLSHMEPKDVQDVGYEMTQCKNIDREQVTRILALFSKNLDQKAGLTESTDAYVRNVMERVLGKEKATNLMERIVQDSNQKGLELFKWMDSRSIAEIIRIEHPQIVSIVLSYLDYRQAADVLSFFPEHLRADVMLRIAKLDTIQPEAMRELNDVIEAQFSGNTRFKMSAMGGLKTAAQILNKMDVMLEGEILDNIREIEPEVGQAIQDLMFVFDNIAELPDKDIQTILREIPSDQLLLALKNVSAKVRQKIYKNMSKRAAQMLQEDLELKGPVKISDVEAAQKEILSTLRRLSDAGDISLRSKVDDEYI